MPGSFCLMRSVLQTSLRLVEHGSHIVCAPGYTGEASVDTDENLGTQAMVIAVSATRTLGDRDDAPLSYWQVARYGHPRVGWTTRPG